MKTKGETMIYSQQMATNCMTSNSPMFTQTLVLIDLAFGISQQNLPVGDVALFLWFKLTTL